MFVPRISRALFAKVGGLAAFAIVPSAASAAGKTHKIAFQVSQNDPAIMNLTLNNVTNLANFYSAAAELWSIEVVAYGPGLHMLRADDSPVKERLRDIAASINDVTFSACNNTLQAMQKVEGHAISIVPQAHVVPAGVVRLAALQELGYSYIKP